MELFAPNKLPKLGEIKDTPTDNPLSVYKVCQELEFLCTKEDGVGLSAIQVGIPWRLFVAKVDSQRLLEGSPSENFIYVANGDYEGVTDTGRVVSLEGCLSLRSDDGRRRAFRLERYSDINIKGLRLVFNNDLIFEEFNFTLSIDEASIVFQHEIDHQKGILISDVGTELHVWK